MQALLAALLVFACGVYAAWVLLPGAARHSIARLVLRLDLPPALRAPFERALKPAGGCASGCDGCGPKPITIHRRR